MTGNTYTEVDAGLPLDARLRIVLNAQRVPQSIDYALFAERPVVEEMAINRATTFVVDMLQKAARRGSLIEDVQRHFKNLEGFTFEYELIKVIAELQARQYGEWLQPVLNKRRGAA